MADVLTKTRGARADSPGPLRILGRANSFNVRKVLWVCDEIGIDYTREDFGRGFAPTNTPDFLKLNPTGQVPVVIEGDRVMRESNTIVRYLAAKHGATDLCRCWRRVALAEIGLQHLRVASDRRRLAIGNEAATVQHHDAADNAADQRHVVVDEKDGLTGRRQRQDDVAERALGCDFASCAGAGSIPARRCATSGPI